MEEQDEDEHAEGDGVLVRGKLAAADERLDRAENQAAERGAGKVANAAQHGGDESLQPVRITPMSGSMDG